LPHAPLRPCLKTGCNKKVRSGYCPEHQREKYKLQDEQRGTSTERGYDATWQKLRKLKLATNPLCELCLKKGIVEPATEVDHKIPIAKWPEGRLIWENLQSLSKSCHSRKTLAENQKLPNSPIL
jgi:5-methylcytosine-specific restriction protein A